MQIKSLAVFCGSKSGNNPLFVLHAEKLGGILAAKGIELVYGGGSTGIMGAVANAVLNGNGKVTGIIPHLLTEWEHQHKGITELILVDDMHMRKKMLYEKSNAAIILAGGFGTLDEMFEMLTWNQLSIHNKKIYILNSGGFYDALIEHMNMLQRESFLYDKIEDRITVLNEPEEFEQYI